MKRIIEFIRWFLYITTGILFVCAVNMQSVGNEMIPLRTLWEILFSGVLTTLLTVLLVPREGDRGGMTYIKVFLHYTVLCVVMIVCGNRFGWVDWNVRDIIMMLVSVFAVYLLAFWAYYITNMKQANEINKRLKEKYEDEK